jgi:transcriptional regulator with XRE-family HTH domain
MRTTSHPIDKHVGNRIRARRNTLKLSQTELGEALNITFQQVQKYEKGSNRVSASVLYMMSGILEVPVDYFFDGLPKNNSKGDFPSPKKYDHFLTSREAIGLIEALDRLEPSARKMVIQLATEAARIAPLKRKAGRSDVTAA